MIVISPSKVKTLENYLHTFCLTIYLNFELIIFLYFQVCVPRIEERCNPVPPQTVCNTIVKLMSYPVPVLSCD